MPDLKINALSNYLKLGFIDTALIWGLAFNQENVVIPFKHKKNKIVHSSYVNVALEHLCLCLHLNQGAFLGVFAIH